MPGHRDTAALALIVLMTVAIGVSHAAERRGDDCLVGWRVGTETAARPGSRRVVCRDGDPACDGDGAADGACSVAVAVCRALPGCEGRDAGDRRTHRRRRRRGGAERRAARQPHRSWCPPGGARRLGVTATAPDGGRDRDRLRLVCARSRGARAVVLTTDFETGVLATLPAASPRRVGHPDTPVHSDAVLRSTGGRLVVVNRFLGDNIQLLDPDRGFATRLQCSTGVASNPHDIVAVAPDKAYVTRYGRPELWVVDPSASSCDGFRRGTIDLSAFADADGLPEMGQMGWRTGVCSSASQRLDRTPRLRADRPQPAGRDRPRQRRRGREHQPDRRQRLRRRQRHRARAGDRSAGRRHAGRHLPRRRRRARARRPGDAHRRGALLRRPRMRWAATSPTSSCCRR